MLLLLLLCRHMLYDKELLEYRHWLEGVQTFVAGSSK
jgi:hypothetical protein